jgi:oligoendopeptidase F
MSACRIVRIDPGFYRGMLRAMSAPADPAQPSDGGPAAGICWDLGPLYAGPDDPRIDADLDAALTEADGFAARHRGRVAGLAPAALAAVLDELEAIHERVARAAVYSHLLFAADTSVPRHGALLQHVQERVSEIKNTLLFFELEWVGVEAERAEATLGEPALAARRHFLGALRRYRPHLLSEPEERILEDSANTGRRAFGRLFDELISTQRFRVRRDGQEQDLGEEEVLALLYEPDRELRREAARALTEGLGRCAHPLAFIFNTLAQDKATEDRLRSYETSIASRNLANEIDGKSVESLLDACVARYPLVARYYRLKARLLGLERLEDYDRYAPIASQGAQRSFAEARRIVLDAYGDFSPELASVAATFFEERRIDAELRPGKRGGAFCASTIPSLPSYVMLNYTGNLRDVMTVAHEIGHAVHQTLAAGRGLFEQTTPLTMAETASVFGEMLVFRRLLREERDPRVRLALLCGKLEDAFATVFRQVAMTRFEESLHAARRREGELSIDRIGALWMEANRPMFGGSVHLSDDYARWWLYIPHFVHSPFYCYAYAFGELLVLALLRRYDGEGPSFVPRYLDLLRAGGSEAPQVLLGRIGLDVSNPEFWDGGLELLEEMVAEAETLAG